MLLKNYTVKKMQKKRFHKIEEQETIVRGQKHKRNSTNGNVITEKKIMLLERCTFLRERRL